MNKSVVVFLMSAILSLQALAQTSDSKPDYLLSAGIDQHAIMAKGTLVSAR